MKISIKTLQNIKDLCKSGLYAFINDLDKKVYLVYTIDVINSIGKHLTLLERGIHEHKDLQKDYLKLSLVFLEEENDGRFRRIYYEFYKLHYKKLGYTFYRNHKAIGLKVKISIEECFRTNQYVNTTRLKVYVRLWDTNNNSFVVGVFSKMDEAKDFVKAIYSPMKVITPVYAYNLLTKEYLELQKKQIHFL